MTTPTQSIIPGYDIGRMGISVRGGTVVLREDLEYRDGGSDKFYIGIISQTGPDFFVDFFYGRRGAHASSSGVVGPCSSEFVAKTKMDAQLSKKKAKGYKQVGSRVGSVLPVKNSDRYEERIVWPMGAIALPEKKRQDIIDSPDWIAEVKEDGVRLTIHITPGGLRFFTRNASVNDPTRPIEKTSSLSFQSMIQFADKYVGTIIDVEALADGYDAAQISGMLNATDGRDTSMIYFKAFDLIQEGTTDLTSLEWKYRRTKLTQLLKDLAADSNSTYTYTDKNSARQTIPLFSEDDLFGEGLFRLSRYTIKDKEEFHNEIIAAGGEGTMWKNIESKYKEGGKPANHWYKWKKQDTADVVVMGYTPAKEGKYAGLIGAVRYGQWMSHKDVEELGLKADTDSYNATTRMFLVEIGQCSGMTDAIRKEITANEFKFIGRVMEVEFMERTKTRALRHPRFVRWRDDKHNHDCIYNPNETSGKLV